jgi:hypothetical protein
MVRGWWWGVKVTVNQDSLVHASLALHARASGAASEEAAQKKRFALRMGLLRKVDKRRKQMKSV